MKYLIENSLINLTISFLSHESAYVINDYLIWYKLENLEHIVHKLQVYVCSVYVVTSSIV